MGDVIEFFELLWQQKSKKGNQENRLCQGKPDLMPARLA
jgi:hypothetical protein